MPPTPPRLRCVMFDLDGTLVDTPRAITETLAASLETLGYTDVPTEALRATIGLPLETAFSRTMGRASSTPEVQAAVRAYRARYAAEVVPRSRELLFPGVAKTLPALAREGLWLALTTSKVHTVAEATLEAAGLRGCFALVVGNDDVPQSKPHPAMALHVLKHFGIGPEEAVLVGDTTHDLFMARAAGVRAVGVTYGVHDRALLATATPVLVADTFAEVAAYLRG